MRTKGVALSCCQQCWKQVGKHDRVCRRRAGYRPVELGKELDYITLMVSLQVHSIFVQLLRAGEGH